MHAGTLEPNLVDFIESQVRVHGPVTFRWFMENALYHPEFGYYAKPRPIIGRHGDFYTNVSVGAVFGQLMARQFEQMWQLMGEPMGFGIVEQGAHDGLFARDVLEWLRDCSPDLYAETKYFIIEPLPHLRQAQEETLDPFGNKIRWMRSFAEIDEGALTGVFFCNELLDAFPVHLVTSMGGMWYENYVEVDGGRFRFVYAPPSTERLQSRMGRVLPDRPDGYRTEINVRALDWAHDVSRVLRRGFMTVIDYGMTREDYYAPERATGTLACYHKHQRGSNPFENVGSSDLTAHVEFTSIAEESVICGMNLAGFTDQHHFMVGAGKDQFDLIENANRDPSVAKALRCFNTLMHPSHMGLAFKFLIMSKNVENASAITGLEFAPDPVRTLALP
jgi:SAM-dependent MidA family methyltransferase